MSRWLIVSNRLPIALDKKTQKLKQSSGGLVTAINGIKTSSPIHWIGSLAPGITNKHLAQYKPKDKTTFSFPKISKELYHSYYNKFCNDVLWPLLHYETELVDYNQENFEDYIKVNKLFAEHIAKVSKKDDVVWINDFHLFMVPKFLKQLKPNLKIGYHVFIFCQVDIFIAIKQQGLIAREYIIDVITLRNNIFIDCRVLRRQPF